MQRRSSLIVITVLYDISQSTVAAGALPHRKSGLWETTMSAQQRPGGGYKSQQCIDEKTDEITQRRALGTEQTTKCEHQDFRTMPGGYETTSVCTTTRGTLTSKLRITGDLQSAYRMEVSSHHEPAVGKLADASTVIDAKWLGACPAGMKPGDLRVNGMVLHLGGGSGAPGTTATGSGPPLDAQALRSMTPEQRLEYIKSRMGGATPQQ